jgi:hypothetical protein
MAMIWLHGLILMLLAWAAAIESRTRNLHDELILAGLCQSALWTWVPPGGGRMAWGKVPLSGLAMALMERWS